MFTCERLQEKLSELTTHPYFCIAYSGGIDSHVLLHAFTALNRHTSIFIRAVHVNHNENPEDLSVEVHCKKICEALDIPFLSLHVDLFTPKGESVQASARRARYRAFQEILQPNENLVTAHTADDQAETLLLQLLRGAGIPGLKAMTSKKKFGKGFFLRPFLDTTRADLIKYACDHKLKWWEDKSNQALQFNRNYLRHEVLPLLTKRWPQMIRTVGRSASHLLEANDLLNEVADHDLTVLIKEEAIDILAFLRLSIARQKLVLRRFIQKKGFRLPHAKHIHHVLQALAVSSKPAILLRWDRIGLGRYQNRLYLVTFCTHATIEPLVWNLKNPLKIDTWPGKLVAHQQKGEGLSSKISSQLITVRNRVGGEKCRLVGRAGTHTLKKLFQEWQVPPWKRAYVPLIYVDGVLAEIVGYTICANFVAEPHEMGWMITWEEESLVDAGFQ